MVTSDGIAEIRLLRAELEAAKLATGTNVPGETWTDAVARLEAEVERLRADLEVAESRKSGAFHDLHKRATLAEGRLTKLVEKLEEKQAILESGLCSPTFDREEVAIMMQDLLAAAQPEGKRHDG